MFIDNVIKNSIAEELNIKAGDELIAFDGLAYTDALDYEYYNSLESFTMTVSSNGALTEFEIDKYADEDLGLEFDREIKPNVCKNSCIFCFVKQLPKRRLRPTLHVKDDDYRHSFISGNYITLTNLSDDDFKRIARLHLSPLYISVHSTTDSIRTKLLGNPAAPPIMEQLRYLKDSGIKLHTQIVYCPGINEDYLKSIDDLSAVAESLAIVPVGLTKDCNPELRQVTKEEAINLVKAVHDSQKKYFPFKGDNYVYAADEFYVKGELPVPDVSEYGSLDQLENGIGMLSLFNAEFNSAINEFNGKIGSLSIATGSSAYPYIKACADAMTAKFGGIINVYRIENTFFGSSVTVAGLIVGCDLVDQLRSRELGDRLLIPRTMLREFHDVFLDDMSVRAVSESLGVQIVAINTDGESFVKAVLEI